jgi:replicative DNA helicase
LHDVGLIIIDYLQLMSGSSDNRNSNREQEISTISRNLKQLAKELQVPIIALSQLSREVEKRKDGQKVPQLSDLRESGAIEQDADIVGFIYRPEYYGILTNAEGHSTVGLAQILIAKHRNGAISDVDLEFKKELAKFTDRDHHGYNPSYGGSMSPNTSFDTSSSTTITVSSKINTMPDEEDDDDFGSFSGGNNDVGPF